MESRPITFIGDFHLGETDCPNTVRLDKRCNVTRKLYFSLVKYGEEF